MHSFHISPQRTPHAPAEDAGLNPFSNPRLLTPQSAAPSRHASPYALARGVAETEGTRAALAEAQRAAESGAEADALLASLMLSGGGDRASEGLHAAAAVPYAHSANYHSYNSPVRVSPSASSSPSRPLRHPHPPSPGMAGAASSPLLQHSQLPSPVRAASSGSGSSNGLSAASSSPQQQEHDYYVLLKASREGDCNTVRQLLSSNAQAGTPLQVDSTDRDGDTALHRACAGGHTSMVHLLVLEAGACIHARNHAGDTPLLVNALSAAPQPTLLRFLVECGGDIHDKNKAGVSVASLMGGAAATASPAASQQPQHQQQPHSAFGFSSLTAAATMSSSSFSSPSRSSSAAAPLAELQSQLLAAHASPVRQFVLCREQELSSSRAELTALREQCAALERSHQSQAAQLARQEAQLRAAGSAVHVATTQLRDMDAELERVAAHATAPNSSSSAPGSPAAPPPPPPQVLISEVRRALHTVRSAVAQAAGGSG